MGIPNLANRRWGGQEWQSRCKLAMPNLAIHLGYHWPAGSPRIAAPAHPGFIAGSCDRIPRKVRDPDDKLPIRSYTSYRYARLLS